MQRNCGIIAYDKLVGELNGRANTISMNTLKELALDNGFILYPMKVPIEDAEQIIFPCIVYTKHHFEMWSELKPNPTVLERDYIYVLSHIPMPEYVMPVNESRTIRGSDMGVTGGGAGAWGGAPSYASGIGPVNPPTVSQAPAAMNIWGSLPSYDNFITSTPAAGASAPAGYLYPSAPQPMISGDYGGLGGAMAGAPSVGGIRPGEVSSLGTGMESTMLKSFQTYPGDLSGRGAGVADTFTTTGEQVAKSLYGGDQANLGKVMNVGGGEGDLRVLAPGATKPFYIEEGKKWLGEVEAGVRKGVTGKMIGEMLTNLTKSAIPGLVQGGLQKLMPGQELDIANLPEVQAYRDMISQAKTALGEMSREELAQIIQAPVGSILPEENEYYQAAIRRLEEERDRRKDEVTRLYNSYGRINSSEHIDELNMVDQEFSNRIQDISARLAHEKLALETDYKVTALAQALQIDYQTAAELAGLANISISEAAIKYGIEEQRIKEIREMIGTGVASAVA